MPEPKFVLVVGASAGGLNSVTELCSQLKENMNLAVFVVVHLHPSSLGSIVLQRIQRSTSYKCAEAEDGKPIESNHIYMALADRHLLVKKGKMLCVAGRLNTQSYIDKKGNQRFTTEIFVNNLEQE